MAHLYFSAAHKSSGKTTLTVAIAAALASKTGRGLNVHTFKKGPDYIDPLWLARATGNPCYNLDYNTQSREEIDTLFHRVVSNLKRPADIALIEGNKGLFDGMDVEGRDSNAALAAQLKAPIVLIIDVRGITRGIAPLLLGYQQFGPELDLRGVIFNKVGGPRHESKLRQVLERYTDLPLLGTIGYARAGLAAERHLGLVPPNETAAAEKTIGALQKLAEENVDLDGLLRIAQQAPSAPPPSALSQKMPPSSNQPIVKIGIARDEAFAFYYEDDLEALRAAGAELIPIDTLKRPDLKGLDGLFLGGGFPEMRMAALEANQALRAEIKALGEAGLPIYAECGGLMYLSRSISWHGETRQMVGLIPGDTIMHDNPQGRGLVRLRETGEGPWAITPQTTPVGSSIKAHEFHHASLEGLPEDARFAFIVERGAGITGTRDGFCYKNIMAGFSHLRSTAQSPWAQRFVDFVRRTRFRQ